MHTLLSAFFAALFSLSHPAYAPKPAPLAVDPQFEAVYQHVPNRYELAQLRSSAVYSGSACLACRKTTVTYRAR